VKLSPDRDEQLSRLMKQAQAGNARAYQTLLQEVCMILRDFLERRSGGPNFADDVLQEVLLGIHTARHTYDPAQPFAPWMYAIARHKLADHWRRIFRLNEHELTDDSTLEKSEAPEEQSGSSLGEKVNSALDELPERQRQVVNLLKVERLSIKEAAQKMNMTETAIKVTAHRAYKALRKKFEGEVNATQ